MTRRNFELTDSEMEQALANVGMTWSDFEKEEKKKKTFEDEPLDVLDEEGAIEYNLRSVKKAGRKTKKKRKSKKRGGVRGKRPPPLAITKEELDEVPGEPDEMHRDVTDELIKFRRAIGVDEEEEDDSEREIKSTSPEDKENMPSPAKKAKMVGGSRKKRRRKTKRRRKSRKSRKSRRHRK